MNKRPLLISSFIMLLTMLWLAMPNPTAAVTQKNKDTSLSCANKLNSDAQSKSIYCPENSQPNSKNIIVDHIPAPGWPDVLQRSYSNYCDGLWSEYIITSFYVPDHLLITDVDLGINMAVAKRNEITMYLFHPDGEYVEVISEYYEGSGSNFDILVDDNGPSNPPQSSNDDLASPYFDRPIQPPYWSLDNNKMSNFNGKSSHGIWTIHGCHLNHDWGWDVAVLYRTQLRISGEPIHIATDDNYSTAEHTLVAGNLIKDDTGFGFDQQPTINGSLDLFTYTLPFTGSLVINPAGNFYYMPPPSWSGTVSFTYSNLLHYFDVAINHPTRANLGNGDSLDSDFGDIDNDGDLDLLFANDNDQAEEIWINDGSGNFSLHLSFGNGNSSSTTFADLDNDGDLDIVIGNYNQPEEIWLNQGLNQAGTIGNFVFSSSFGGGYSKDIDVADIDGDTDLDIFVTNYGEPNELWVNDGSALFTLHSTYGNSNSNATEIADLNNDGHPDLVIANSGQAQEVWFNDGLGNFTLFDSFGSGLSTSLDLGDLDGDGDLDAFIVNSWWQPHAVWLNQGGIQAGIPGDFGESNVFSFGGGFSNDIELGDLDGDGDLDALVVNSFAEENEIWLNQGAFEGGNGFSSAPIYLGSPAESYAVSLGDWNLDGTLDAVIAQDNFATNDLLIFNDLIQIADQQSESNMATVNINILPADDATDGTYFGAEDQPISGNIINEDTGFDIDNNAIEINSYTNPITGSLIISMDGNYAYTPPPDWSGTINYNYDITFTEKIWPPTPNLQYSDDINAINGSDTDASGDFDNDGDIDLIITPSQFANPEVWLNQGGVQAGTPGDFLFANEFNFLGLSSEQTAVGDLDGDNDLDLIIITTSQKEVWLNQGGIQGGTLGQFAEDMTSAPFDSFTLGTNSQDIELGDIDLDGDLDAIVANYGDHTHEVWLNDGNGNFDNLPFSIFTTGHGGNDLDLGDVDKDGDLDVVAIGNATVEVWLNQGSRQQGTLGTFGTAPFNTFAYGGKVELGDIDLDGDLDAFVQTASGVEFWLNQGGVQNGIIANYAQAGGISESAQNLTFIFLDIDQDTDLDIASAAFGSSYIWLNQGSAQNGSAGEFIQRPKFAQGEYDNPTFGDFDSDGDIDIILDNWDSNAQYGRPSRLFINEENYVNRLSNSAVITLTINAVNDPPIATDGLYTATSVPISGNIILEDSGFNVDNAGDDGGLLSIYTYTQPAIGSLILATDGNFTYTPVLASAKTTSFTYTIYDNTVSIVTSPDDINETLFPNMPTSSSFIFNTSYHYEGEANYLTSEVLEDTALGDLDGDGDLDVVVASSAYPYGQILLNQGVTHNGMLIDFSPFSTFGPNFTPSINHDEHIELADLDQDNDLDLVTVDSTNIKIWFNQGGIQGGVAAQFGTTAAYTLPLGSGTPEAIAIVNLTQPGPEIIAGETIWFNDGEGNFIPITGEFPLSTGYDTVEAIELADFDGDNDLDLARIVSGPNGRRVEVWSSHSPLTYSNGPKWTYVLYDPSDHYESFYINVGKANDDDYIDLWISRMYYDINYTAIFLGSPDNSNFSLFESIVNNDNGNYYNYTQPLLGDFDGDNDLDLLIDANQGKHYIWINLGNAQSEEAGSFNFTKKELFQDGGGYFIYGTNAIGDIDNDGDLDVLTSAAFSEYPQYHTTHRVWLNEPSYYEISNTATVTINNCGIPLNQTNIQINANVSDTILSWPSFADSYEIYRSNIDPYFIPSGIPYATTLSTTYNDTNIGAPAERWFYKIIGISECGISSDSNSVGLFEFVITPGS